MDPSEMSDEELRIASGAEQPEETPTKEGAPVASPEKEEPKEETPAEAPAETETESPDETPAETESEETPAPSRREQLRVQQLLKKYGPPPEEQPKPAPSQEETSPEIDLDWLDAEDSVKNLIRQSVKNAVPTKAEAPDVSKQMASMQWDTLLRVDTPSVMTKYPALNPANKQNFRPALSDSINRLYLQTVGFDPATKLVDRPEIRYTDFVESYYELAEEIASTQVAKSVENVTRQAANTGLRPSGGAAKGLDLNKAPEDMTDEELKAAVNASMPRDRRGRFTKQ